MIQEIFNEFTFNYHIVIGNFLQVTETRAGNTKKKINK